MTQRGSGANMSVDVSTGGGFIQALTGPYMYSGFTDAVENVTVTAANPSNPRKDTLVAYVDLSVVSSASNNNPNALVFKAVAGTAAASPSDPSDSAINSSVGAGNPWIKLRRINVSAGATQIVNANIDDVSTPAALAMPRLYGGASNTKGHLVPNLADATIITTGDTDSVTDTILDYPRWWQEIARTTVSSPTDTLTVSSIPARKYLKIQFTGIATGGTLNCILRVNNDSTGTYYYDSIDNGGHANVTGATSWPVESGTVSSGGVELATYEILNVASVLKMLIGDSVTVPGGGAAPNSFILKGFWNNSVSQINRIDIINSGTGDFAAGSEIIVLGHD